MRSILLAVGLFACTTVGAQDASEPTLEELKAALLKLSGVVYDLKNEIGALKGYAGFLSTRIDDIELRIVDPATDDILEPSDEPRYDEPR